MTDRNSTTATTTPETPPPTAPAPAPLLGVAQGNGISPAVWIAVQQALHQALQNRELVAYDADNVYNRSPLTRPFPSPPEDPWKRPQ